MSLQIISTGINGGCSPSGDLNSASGCSSCAPKLALSYEEEAILSRMRSVKNEVRPISRRLKELESIMSTEIGYRSSILKNEYSDLSRQLSELRQDWIEWSVRLEDATERKLVLLGHREPHPGPVKLNWA